jgi:hypothetical protein
MSGLIKKPKNTNLLQPTKYTVSFPEIPDTVYFCQKVNLPGVSITELTQVTPNLDLFVPGTKITYNNFDMEFLINEDISSWLYIYNWMRGITTDMGSRTKPQTQAILTIFSNQNNPKIRIKYRDIFPLNLSDIQFDTTQSAEEHMYATATFKYNYFDIEKL